MHLESESPPSSHGQSPCWIRPTSLGLDGCLWWKQQRDSLCSLYECVLTHQCLATRDYSPPRRHHSPILSPWESGPWHGDWGRHTIRAILILTIMLSWAYFILWLWLEFEYLHMCWRLDLLSAVSTGGTLHPKNCDIMGRFSSKSVRSWALVGVCDKWGPVNQVIQLSWHIWSITKSTVSQGVF